MPQLRGVAARAPRPARPPRRRRSRSRLDRGASAVEYALLLAGIAALIVIAVAAFGINVLALFERVCQPFSSDGC